MTGPVTGSPPSGPRGVATALTTEARADNYRQQTGRPLTARQSRRIRHKTNRAAVRSA